TSQFADHLSRSHFLRLCADGWPAFLVPNAFEKKLPNETTQPVRAGPNGLRVPEARDEPSIHDGEDGALGLHGGVRGLIQDASHPAVALGAAVTVVLARALLGAGARSGSIRSSTATARIRPR